MGDFQKRFGAVFPRHSVESPYISCLSDQQTATGNLSLQVAASLQAVEGLRPIWKKWTHNLDTDFDYYLHNLKNDSAITQPYVITVYRDGAPDAMLVGQVRRQRISTVVSSVNIRGPEARMLEVVKGGRMGRQAAAIDRLLTLQLLRAARSLRVDLVCFQRLPLESDLFRMLREAPDLLMKTRVPHRFLYSVVPLTASPNNRVRALSGKNRREVRRKTRILQRAFPGKARVQCFSRPDELEAGLHEACSVDVATWQHYLGLGFVDAQHGRANLAFCAERGWLRIYVMYVDQFPVAFLIGQHYNETFYCQHAGYHPDFSSFSVGSLLTASVLEGLAATGVEKVDLGEGSSPEHNRRLGCRIYEEGTVHVYSPTYQGLCLNIFFAVTQAIRVVGRGTIARLRLSRASKVWLRFLMSRWRAGKLVGDSCLQRMRA